MEPTREQKQLINEVKNWEFLLNKEKSILQSLSLDSISKEDWNMILESLN